MVDFNIVEGSSNINGNVNIGTENMIDFNITEDSSNINDSANMGS
jgi:hypothetical protein